MSDATEPDRGKAPALAARPAEILENLPDAFYAVDRDWRFTYVNRRAEEWWRRSREELLGKVYWDEFPQAVGSQPHEAHLRAARTREVVRLEAVSPILGHWVDISIVPTADGGLSVHFRDISERKRTEAGLRESEDRFRAIVETATDYAIFTTDPEGRIVTWPPGAQGVFGWPAEEAIGASVDLTFTSEDRARGVPGRERDEARSRGQALDIRWHLRRDGSRVFIDGVTRPLTGPGGTLAGFVKVGQDVTERRRAEERLQLATEAANLGIFDVDLASGAIEWDARMRSVWGVGPDEPLTDAAFVEGIHPDDREAVRAALGRALDPEGERLYRAEYRVRHRGTGDECWVAALGRVHFDGPRPVRLVGTVQDVTERRQAEGALRASEERFRALAEQAVVGICLIDRDQRFLYANETYARIVGRPLGDVLGRSVEELTAPEDWARNEPLLEAALSGGEPFVIEKRYLRPDGSPVWVRNSVSARRDGSGEIAGGIAVSMDVTDRRAAEEALRESEERFRQFGEASGDVLWIRDAGSLAFEYLSPAFEEVFGVPLAALLDGNHLRGWAGRIVPEDREQALDAIRRAREGEHVLHAFRILRSDGQVRWVRDTVFPLLAPDGRVQRVAGILRDVTEETDLQNRLRVVVAELQHRTRNLMSVVRSLADRTLAGSASLEDFEGRFRDRLRALARVNGLLSRLDEGDRIAFDQLLQAELSAHGVVDADGRGDQVRLRGPSGIRLRSSTVQTMALGLHELATNALKYGALSRPGGRLEVSWELLPGDPGERLLRVDWHESGVPVPLPDGAPDGDGIVVPFRRRGYGRELIERALPYQLKARTSYELTPDGVRCSITLPVSSTPGAAGAAGETPDA
jgi:two-component system CheB/CheR fusion protein